MILLIFNLGICDLPSRDKDGKLTPHYSRWVNMLRRCYDPKYQTRRNSYADTTVCQEWLTFSKFKEWMDLQDWEGKDLDKDLLGDGTIYSPSTCVFVTPLVNQFTKRSSASRGDQPLGVHLKRNGRYGSCIRKYGKLEHLGYFENEEAAHVAWQRAKIAYGKELCHLQTDERSILALTRYIARIEEDLLLKRRTI